MDALRFIRTSLGLTQAQMAILLGVSRSLISYVEKGDRKLNSKQRSKLYELEKQLMELKKIPRERSKRQRYNTPEDIIIKKVRTEKRLKLMQEKFSRYSDELMRIEILKSIPHDRGQELWYAMKEHDLKTEIKSCNEEMQNKLQEDLDNYKRMLGE